MLSLDIIIGIVSALIGMSVALCIYRKKQKKEKLVCPRTAKCDTVLHSTFAHIGPFPLELVGIAYYVIVGVLYALLATVPWMQQGATYVVLLILISVGALFSLYLVSVQLFRLHTWCMWCMCSALAAAGLVVSLWYVPRIDMFAVLGHQKILWVIIHNIGFILGLGAATVTDVFFFRFLHDGHISEKEKQTMDILSEIIWVGLAILIVSGLMLYLPQQDRLLQSSKFLIKLVVVSVITLNGIVLNIFIGPKMRSLSFAEHPKATYFRRAAFAFGGISIVSWYIAFILGSLRSIPLSFHIGVGAYGIILIGIVVGSQIFERIVTRIQYHERDSKK